MRNLDGKSLKEMRAAMPFKSRFPSPPVLNIYRPNISAPQSPDTRLPLIRSRQIRLPSANNPLTVRSHPPGIPVVPAFEVENCFFLNISFTIIKLIFFLF
jgi:hypothetical protein